MLNGHREFVCLIGSDEGHAMDMLDSIKTELDGNDLLLEDFPEVVYPIQCLDGIANRCNGQLYQGQRTHIGWTAKEIVLPTMPGSMASGAIIKVAGITGRIRGMKYKRTDGQTVRPSLVVLDDPQTDESARSLSQCATRESILAGAVLGLAGPGKKISGIMPCTVIRPGDMADNILGRDKHPEWNGERTKMVYRFPTNEKLWQRYGEIRAESLRQHGDIRLATEFYRRESGGDGRRRQVAWPERFNHDESVGHPARDESEAAGRGGVLRRVPERAACPRNRPGRRTDGRPDRRQDQPHGARRDSDRLQPSDDVHRRAGEAAVLRRGGLGGRLHGLRGRLRSLSRSEATVLHAAGRSAHAGSRDRGQWPGRIDLRGPGAA